MYMVYAYSKLNCCFKYILLVVIFTTVQCQQLNCSGFYNYYQQKGFSIHKASTGGISGTNLRFCPATLSCCSQDLENSLHSHSQKLFHTKIHETLALVKILFSSSTSRFNDFFSRLLNHSKKKLHKMFLSAYGLLYQQNSHIFNKLFDSLRTYYKGRPLDLNDALHEFFVQLLKVMFELINSEGKFSKEYLKCVVSQTRRLKPFGDVPATLSREIIRAFVASRTFVQGLATGRDVVTIISKLPASEKCANGIMKMLYCPQCQGLLDTKPCNGFCTNTMRECLTHHQELNAAWNDYIGALVMVAKRIEGPFNIESVIAPINIKISDAIMNFQDDGIAVSKQIFEICGKPSPRKRSKRSSKSNSTDVVKINFGSKNWKESGSSDAKNEFKLDHLVREIRTKVETAKDYWHQLPHSICNSKEMSGLSNSAQPCWRGHDRTGLDTNIQNDQGTAHKGSTPEDDKKARNTVVILQIDKLKIITNRLQNAYDGRDVASVDVDVYSSGSGDDEDISDIYSSGSGDSRNVDDEDSISGSGNYGSGDTSVEETGTKHIHVDKDKIQKGTEEHESESGSGYDKAKKGDKEQTRDRFIDDKSDNNRNNEKGQYYFISSTRRRTYSRATPSSIASNFSYTSVVIISCVGVIFSLRS